LRAIQVIALRLLERDHVTLVFPEGEYLKGLAILKTA
jgi:hypothetical protein